MSYSKEEIVKIYDEASIKIAEFMSVLNYYKGRFDSISGQTLDNADPLCDAQDCLEKLGILLSSCVIYKNEYEEDIKKQEESIMNKGL